MNYSEQLTSGIATFDLAGASFAYWDGRLLHRAVAGVRNSVTGDPVTFDTVMHIGSITKVINAVLLMQLVDEGVVSLDDPVLKHLPGWRLRDRGALEAITCEMLLNHTSGIDGDWLPECGPDRERIVDVVDRSADLGQLFRPGERTSYCNIATVIAGHLTQTLRGKSWYTLVKRRIFEPLGMRHSLVEVADAPRFRCSIGDLTDPQTGRRVQSTRAYLSPGFAPAGSTLMTSATDLVHFTRSLLGSGTRSDGFRLLSERATARMAKAGGAFASPAYGAGLGWMLAPGGILRHSGVGPGVNSVLYAHPASGCVACLLTNTDRGAVLASALMDPIVESWTGIRTPPPQLKSEPFDTTVYAGAYESNLQRIEVFPCDGELLMRMEVKMDLYDNSPYGPERTKPISKLSPLGEHAFLAEPLLPGGPRPELKFVERPPLRGMRFLGVGHRLLPRLG